MNEPFEVNCPCCGGVQYCPCTSCVERHKETIVWEWHDTGMAMSCGYCSYKMGTDSWMDEQSRQFKEWQRVQCAEKVSNYTPEDQEDNGEIN